MISVLLTSLFLSFFIIAVTHHGSLIVIIGYGALFALYVYVSFVTFRRRSSLLSALPISVVLMVSHRKDNSNSMAWMILGILFILVFAGAMFGVWSDYMLMQAFQGVTGTSGIYGSAIILPIVAAVLFLVLAILSFREARSKA